MRAEEEEEEEEEEKRWARSPPADKPAPQSATKQQKTPARATSGKDQELVHAFAVSRCARLARCRVNGWSYSMHVPESLRGAAACIRTHADAGFTTVHAGMQAAAALTSTLNP